MSDLLMRISASVQAARAIDALRPRFEQMAREATEYTRGITSLCHLYDLKPSVARERFQAYCQQSVHDWQTCLRIMQTEEIGAQWMQGEGDGEG